MTELLIPRIRQSIPAPPPPVNTAAGPQLVTETEFMQQYRIASAAHGGGDIASVQNGAGHVEIFTVGTDGSVWNFYPDPSSDTGYSSVQTGLQASSVAAGVDNNGNIVVFAASNVVLNYVQEVPGQTGAARWGSVQQDTPMKLPASIRIRHDAARPLVGQRERPPRPGTRRPFSLARGE